MDGQPYQAHSPGGQMTSHYQDRGEVIMADEPKTAHGWRGGAPAGMTKTANKKAVIGRKRSGMVEAGCNVCMYGCMNVCEG